MKTRLPAILVLWGLLALGLYLLLFIGPHEPPSRLPPAASSPTPSPVLSASRTAPSPPVSTAPETAGQLLASPVTPPPATLPLSSPVVQALKAPNPAALSPATVLETMRSAIRQYGSRLDGNPVGTNPEITKALSGDNPRQINFLASAQSLQVNAQGELVDSWGTPFFFHQLSGTEMEIRSAGPDRQMWTADDLVTK